MKKVRKIVPHISIILSGMFIVFYFIDRVNSAMNFINHPLSKALLLILSIFSIVTSALLIAAQRRQERRGRDLK